jgi:hypothetical protein
MTNNLIVSAQTSVIVRHEAISSYGIQILVWDCFSAIAMTYVANGKELVKAKKMPPARQGGEWRTTTLRQAQWPLNE